MRGVLALTFLLTLSIPSLAQWNVPVRIEMVGDAAEERQITGLADPDAPDAGVSHAAALATTMAYGQATGTSALVVELVPAPASYTPGMAVTIVPTSANHANATLDVNGLGPVPIVKWGSLPLDSADLQANVPARMVYDGNSFLLLSSNYVPCPPGFFAVGAKYCIHEESQGSAGYFTAALQCHQLDARLCTFSEWIQACRSNAGFIGTVTEGEWVDHAANNSGDAKRVGFGSIGSGDGSPGTAPSCQHGSSTATNQLGGIRCCRNR